MKPFPKNSSFPALELHRSALSTARFHATELSGPASIHVPYLDDEATLVLGSSQDASTYRSSSQTPIARRRSGGGAVLVSRRHLSWFDIWLPTTDLRYTPDVSRSFDWLGQHLSHLIQTFGYPAEAHSGPMVHTAWSKLICFAGLGPGEITIGQKKVVGISQRRNRNGARYQVAVLRRWEPLDYLELLSDQHQSIPSHDLVGTARQLGHVAVALTDHHDAVVDAMIASLT